MKASMIIKHFAERINKQGKDFDVKIALYNENKDIDLEIDDIVFWSSNKEYATIDIDITQTDKVKLL